MNSDKNRRSRILIVDDVPKNIQVVASILQKEGYDMAFAQNGNAALAHIQSHTFDLILLDVMMPGMDGFEVCEELKRSHATKDIPIIFLTAKADTDSIVRGFESGAVDYVTKPFNGTELSARVKTHLALRHSQQDLQEANATKDKFFSIIAHDLKNPFNAILGLSELLTEQYNSFDDEQKKEFICHIKDTCNNTFKLLQNLLEWSRMQTGKIEWKPDELDLYTSSFENITLFKAGAKNKEINLYSDIKKNTMVFADPNMVTMIMRNLVSNAVKFTKPGGEVRISSESHEDNEEITISDTGVGIKKEDIEKLFRIDVHHSTYGTAKEPGTGLGLILCKEFAEKNGGKIWVESEPGKGSRFKFTLPKRKSA